MSRGCFVIMPFSSTASCSDEEWTLIFEELFKPAVEGSGLDYECRRSKATRGNIVASILQELKENYVVIADLTDRNANVFYELGVRHSLKDRTILVAQNADDIPFDLRAYAYHIYNWRTEEGKNAFTKRITALLSDIDGNPDRPDNPVSDFLGKKQEIISDQKVEIQPKEIEFAQPITGDLSEGIDITDFVHKLARSNFVAANIVLRSTRGELLPAISKKMAELNQKAIPNQVRNEEIPSLALGFIAEIEPQIRKIEEFALASVDVHYELGVRLALKLSGELISLSERPIPGRSVRIVQGTPALLAWRMLLFCGAKALADDNFGILNIILKNPIEVEDNSGRFSNLPLIQRTDLFWPDALLGHANFGARYLVDAWDRVPHLHKYFGTKERYYFDLAKLIMILVLASPTDEFGHAAYPTFRLFPEAARSMSSLCSRLSQSPEYLDNIAKSIGETADQFTSSWSERVKRINSVDHGLKFPDPLSTKVLDY